MAIQIPATTVATGRRVRNIAAAADQSWRPASLAVPAMISCARSFAAARFAVRTLEASPPILLTASSICWVARFSMRFRAAAVLLMRALFSSACSSSLSTAEAVVCRFL